MLLGARRKDKEVADESVVQFRSRLGKNTKLKVKRKKFCSTISRNRSEQGREREAQFPQKKGPGRVKTLMERNGGAGTLPESAGNEGSGEETGGAKGG